MEIKMTRFYFNCEDADIFDDEGTNLMRIEAETQAEAEAKILAEPRLVGLSTIDGFDVSFRSGVSDRHFRVCKDDSMEWLTVTQVILTERRPRDWRLFDFDNTGLLHIEKDDAAQIFESDADAVQHVRRLAARGNQKARHALQLHELNQPKIDAERAKLRSTNAGLLAALIDCNGDLPPVQDGVCSVCGREYFGDDIPEDGMCPSDDCPHTIARAAIAKARDEA
jgi:hypothetical protein